MKTSPNIDSGPSDLPSHTEVPESHLGTEAKPTEPICFTKIVKRKTQQQPENVQSDGRVASIDCNVEFSFEKERIKAIEHTQLFASLNTTPVNQDTVLMSTKLAELVYNDLLHKGRTSALEIQSKENVARILKVLSVVLVLFSTINIIAAFFAILFLSISSMPVGKFIVWISLEIFVSICFMCVSLKGAGAAGFKLLALRVYFRRLVIFFCALLVFFIVLCAIKPIAAALSCAVGWSDQNNTAEQGHDAMLCIVLACLFFTTLYKLLVTVAYVVLSVLLWRRLLAAGTGEPPAGESQRQPLDVPGQGNSVSNRVIGATAYRL